MRTETTAATAATFHKARYQDALIASTTAASLRTRRLAAAATSTTFLAAPTTATVAATTATTAVNKQTREQQQTTNKTWPPGSSLVTGRRRIAANANSTDTFTCASIEANGSDNNSDSDNNINCLHGQCQSSSEKPNHRTSDRINLLPDLTSDTENHRSVILVGGGAYKRVHQPDPGRHSNEAHRNVSNTRGQSDEFSNLATLATDTDIKFLPPRPRHLTAAQLNQQPVPHEYEELTADEGNAELVDHEKEPDFKSNQPDISATWVAILKNHENQLQLAQKQHQHQQQKAQHTTKASNEKKKPKNLTMATLRPISPQYQHTLDSAISLSKELASRNMADSGESSPKTPNSPDKKRFNFKLKHFSKSYSEASASIRDIESSISDEAKLAYKSLIDRSQFNSSHHPFGCDGGGRSYNNHRNNSPNGLRDLYANDDFHSPTTPPATTSKFKYSTFSVKKTFF